jgi:cell division protein FtsL
MTRSNSDPVHGWRNRPLVREPDPRRAKFMRRMLITLGLALAPAGVFLLQQNECLTLSYKVEAIRSEQESLRKEERDLRVERAELESLTSIEQWAVEKRRLQRPKPENVVIVTSPQTVGPDRLVAHAGTRRAGS